MQITKPDLTFNKSSKWAISNFFIKKTKHKSLSFTRQKTQMWKKKIPNTAKVSKYLTIYLCNSPVCDAKLLPKP